MSESDQIARVEGATPAVDHDKGHPAYRTGDLWNLARWRRGETRP